MKYAVSSCLMGENCKYNGGNNFQKEVFEFLKDQEYICVCPEVLGGLPTPRSCCEIVNGSILNQEGIDCSEAFLKGSKIALEIVRKEHVDMVILQPRSPSCGIDTIYDGTFSGKLIAGSGIFAKLLKEEGICVKHFDKVQCTTLK